MRKYLLFAVLSFCMWGGVNGQLPTFQTINNMPDPSVTATDVWLFDSVSGFYEFADDIMFRKAYALQAGPNFNAIGYIPANATINDSVGYLSVPSGLVANENYIFILNGVTNPAFFAANPDGKSIGGSIKKIDGVRGASLNSGEVDILFFHGATDAPTIDIVPQGSSIPLVNDLSYGDVSSYVSVPAGSYIMNIMSADQSSTLFTYGVDLTGMSGKSVVIFASGFVNPSANVNGPAFSLCYVLPDGSDGCFSTAVSLDTKHLDEFIGIGPNPTDGVIHFYYTDIEGSGDLRLLDMTGRIVYLNSEFGFVNGATLDLGSMNLQSGIYLIQCTLNGKTISKKIMLNSN